MEFARTHLFNLPITKVTYWSPVTTVHCSTIYGTDCTLSSKRLMNRRKSLKHTTDANEKGRRSFLTSFFLLFMHNYQCLLPTSNPVFLPLAYHVEWSFGDSFVVNFFYRTYIFETYTEHSYNASFKRSGMF